MQILWSEEWCHIYLEIVDIQHSLQQKKRTFILMMMIIVQNVCNLSTATVDCRLLSGSPSQKADNRQMLSKYSEPWTVDLTFIMDATHIYSYLIKGRHLCANAKKYTLSEYG